MEALPPHPHALGTEDGPDALEVRVRRDRGATSIEPVVVGAERLSQAGEAEATGEAHGEVLVHREALADQEVVGVVLEVGLGARVGHGVGQARFRERGEERLAGGRAERVGGARVEVGVAEVGFPSGFAEAVAEFDSHAGLHVEVQGADGSARHEAGGVAGHDEVEGGAARAKEEEFDGGEGAAFFRSGGLQVAGRAVVGGVFGRRVGGEARWREIANRLFNRWQSGLCGARAVKERLLGWGGLGDSRQREETERDDDTSPASPRHGNPLQRHVPRILEACPITARAQRDNPGLGRRANHSWSFRRGSLRGAVPRSQVGHGFQPRRLILHIKLVQFESLRVHHDPASVVPASS